jgi:CBS domain-containing protein
MQVKDLMSRSVEFVHPEDSITQAAKKMVRSNIGSLPVINDGQEAIGIITDRDITTRVVSRGLDPTETKVTKGMTKDPIFCKESDDTQTAAEIMKDKQIRRLLVKDNEENFIGIIALGDIALNESKSLSGDVLEDISKPPLS